MKIVYPMKGLACLSKCLTGLSHNPLSDEGEGVHIKH